MGIEKRFSIEIVVVLLLFSITDVLGQKSPTKYNKETISTAKLHVGGSGTVYPVSQAIADYTNRQQKKDLITVSESGTSTGFKELLRGDITILDASRTLTEEELDKLNKASKTVVRIKIGYDGITLFTKSDNMGIDGLTVDELRAALDKNHSATQWSEINPEFPNQRIKFVMPNSHSGTHDFFLNQIGLTESDLSSNVVTVETDEEILEHVKENKFVIGVAGFGVYARNHQDLRALSVKSEDNGEYVRPTIPNIANSDYKLFRRTLNLYVLKDAISNPTVQIFIQNYLNITGRILKTVGYVPLNKETYEEEMNQFNKHVNSTF